ncbi:MAG: DUF2584 family protein [Spirulinaceae cyanobacterium]
MGMPCEVNSLLKLSPSQGYPPSRVVGDTFKVVKQGYRILPINVPLPLVDENWLAAADIVIHKLSWERDRTHLEFSIVRIYDQPIAVK